MHNLKSNFDKFLTITKSTLKDQLNAHGNLRVYPRIPKLADSEVIALSLSAESIGIDSECYLFGKLKTDHLQDFPSLPDRSNYNRRRRILAPFISFVTQRLSAQLNENENVFLVDSIPVPVAQLAREKQSKVCKQHFETAPDKGYSAVQKNWFYGYKLHMVVSAKGVFHSMDLSKASVHDIHYLKDIKYSGLNTCTLIGDKGYLSKTHQLDLFTTSNIRLETPSRNNQLHKERFDPVFKRCRKRIETLFAQLCDQFMLKRNYAKSIHGLSTRIASKIAAVTFLQFINFNNLKPIGRLKYALSF
jgi:hypothetical protein